MPKLAGSHSSTTVTKALLIGDSSAGKTGALASLAAEGYKLRIIDLDNGLNILRNYLTNPNSMYYKKNPKAIENVDYVTLADSMKAVNGLLIPTSAQAWVKAISMLSNWVDGDIKLGPITTWGPDCVLVIDSLSMLSTAALNFHLSMNNALGKLRTQNEGRRDVGVTQNMLRDLLQMLYNDAVKCNVIVISHITSITELGGKPEDKNDFAQGYPSAIGRALSPHIPRWFNTVLIARTIGSGASAQHKIYTTTQSMAGMLVNGKNANPLMVKEEYPLSTGLADFFKAVKGKPEETDAAKSPVAAPQSGGELLDAAQTTKQ